MMTNASMTNNSSRQFDRKLLIHLLVKVYLQTKVSNIQWILNIQHTCKYIHNWSLQPFSQDYDLVSYTNFTHEWRYLRFKVDSERQIVWRNFSWQYFILFLEFLPEICWEAVVEEIFILIHILVLMSDLGFEPRPHVYYNKPTHFQHPSSK